MPDPEGRPPAAVSGPTSGWRHPYRDRDRQLNKRAMSAFSGEPVLTPFAVNGSAAARKVSRLATNMVIFGLVLAVLGIPIYIGLHHLPQTTYRQTSGGSPTSVATAVVTAGYQGYTSQDFNIAYPAAWQSSAAPALTPLNYSLSGQSFSHDANTRMTVYSSTAFPADELQQLQDATASALAPTQTPQGISSGAVSTIAGLKWYHSDYIVTRVEGNSAVTLRVRVLVANAGARGYVVIMMAPQAEYSHDDSTWFEKMLTSLRVRTS